VWVMIEGISLAIAFAVYDGNYDVSVRRTASGNTGIAY
jgi:hypothetical protein